MSTLTKYTPFYKNWDKQSGKRPTTKEVGQVHKNQLAREGTKNAFALAMALRSNGATQSQIEAILGHPHRNKIKQVVSRKQATLVPMPKLDGVTVYKIKLRARKG